MEPQAPSLNPNLRLLCSYSGRIISLPPENFLHYIGGETRLVVVPRDISFPAFFELLSNKLLSGRSFSLKYRLPGCDLDSLITVSNNDDLQNMIAEYDSTRFRRIRLFLFPLSYPEPSLSEPSRRPMPVNRLLGLESPIQKIAFTSSSSVVPIPIFPPNSVPAQFVCHNKVDATAEENRKQDDEAPTTSAFFLPPENTASVYAGGVSGRETEIEIQGQPRPIIQEPLPQQPFIMCYLPIWPMQPHMINHPVATYTLSPATEHSSRSDTVAEIRKTRPEWGFFHFKVFQSL